MLIFMAILKAMMLLFMGILLDFIFLLLINKYFSCRYREEDFDYNELCYKKNSEVKLFPFLMSLLSETLKLEKSVF